MKLKRKISILVVLILLILLLQVLAPLFTAQAVTKTKEEILSGMTTKEKIAQMLMPEFRTFDGVAVTTLNDQLENLLANYGFAGVILFAQNNASTEQTTRLIDSIQKANIKNGYRPGLLVSVDQEGAGVSRLASGTQGPGNMALGATDDSQNAYTLGEIIGEELNAIGYNVDFAPVVDVNDNPANPVIGVRSFSDDANIVAEFGNQFMLGLKSQNIITALKHFPGHGNTATDTHSGLSRIEKTYDELKETELVSFKTCIENGAEMVMTAHIQYPEIETDTYTSVKDGTEIELPATLSKKIITDILREDLGFDGVVVTDAMNMKAISDHFDKIDSAELAIRAGVDILLMPVNALNSSGIASIEEYITAVADRVDNDETLMENVNEAVLRILTLKENHGLLDLYDGSDIESKASNADTIVGSKENHDKEWEITRKSITLVKNDEDMLPIQNNEKTVVLVPYANEVLSGEYAIQKLKEDGIIPEDMDISTFLIRNVELSVIQDTIKDAKNVILITELYSQAGLAGASYTTADSIIDFVHEQGNKIACISCNLPYDVARIQNADSILLAYSAKGMNASPVFDNGSVSTFGVSIPCGIYTVFDKDARLGKLPVNIPKLNDEYKYTDEYLYQRGYGLQYLKEYHFIEGENQTLDLAESSELKFEFDMDYDLFVQEGKVYVDNELVDVNSYELSRGSTIVTFNDDYTNSLETGEHVFKALVYNGEIETRFTLAKTETPINNETETQTNTTTNEVTTRLSETPKTGDSILVYIVIFVISAIGMIVVAKKK